MTIAHLALYYEIIISFISDPHIKVIGMPNDVKAAKEKIMSILDTKVKKKQKQKTPK